MKMSFEGRKKLQSLLLIKMKVIHFDSIISWHPHSLGWTRRFYTAAEHRRKSEDNKEPEPSIYHCGFFMEFDRVSREVIARAECVRILMVDRR